MISMFRFGLYYIYNWNIMRTNINISGENKVFNYLVEYADGEEYSNKPFLYKLNENKFTLCINEPKFIRNINTWQKLEDMLLEYETNVNYYPESYSIGYITLYFPVYSLDTYKPGSNYAITISIKIGNTDIILGSQVINRMDALAVPHKRVFGQDYLEGIQIPIINPFDLIYDTNWSNFRQYICGKSLIEKNDITSLLHISLQPVDSKDDIYIKSNTYTGCQNSLQISNTNYLKLHICTNINNYLQNEAPSIVCDMLFNNKFTNFGNYLKSTYGLTSYKAKYKIVIGNETDIYFIGEKESQNGTVLFDKSEIVTEGNFSNWDGWKEGIFIIGSIDILDENDNNILYILSNKLPFSQDIYKFFVNNESDITLNSVNLDSINMNLVNISAINKIENKIIKTQAINESKNHLIQPIFFRSVESSNIIIHPKVTETICINLDIYKSKVDRFVIQIDGVNFNEIGRTSAGILFKIHHNKLSGNNQSGNYYILNTENELVTSGKYTYA